MEDPNKLVYSRLFMRGYLEIYKTVDQVQDQLDTDFDLVMVVKGQHDIIRPTKSDQLDGHVVDNFLQNLSFS